MIKQKQQVIKLWSEEVMMVRTILKEVSDEAVERVGRKEELDTEIEVMIEAIEGENKLEKTTQENDQQGRGTTGIGGGRLRKRKNRKEKGNKREQIKITKYYKRKGVDEEDLQQNKRQRLELEEESSSRLRYQKDLTKRSVIEEVVEEIVSVGWELFERRKRARRKMWVWKIAGSILDEILEVTILDGKVSECGAELSSVGRVQREVLNVECPDILDDDVTNYSEVGLGLSHFQGGMVLDGEGTECGKRLRQSQDCLSVAQSEVQDCQLQGSLDERKMKSDTRCGFGSRQFVGQSVAEWNEEPMDLSLESEVESERGPNESKIPKCRNELSMEQGPSVAMVVQLDKGAVVGGGVVQKKLDCFLKTFPNLKKIEANRKQRKNDKKQLKTQKKEQFWVG